MFIARIAAMTTTALVATAGIGSAATIGIDNFQTDQRVIDVPAAGQTNTSQVADDTAIGGFRDMSVTNFSSTDEATELRATNGILGFSNIVMNSGRGMITYDGDDDASSVNTTGLGGVDLTAAGENGRFNFDIVEADRELGFEVNVFDMVGGSSSFSQILPGGDNINPELAFSEFMGNADFSDVGALEFAIFSTGDNLDGALREITVTGDNPPVVPLPAAGWMLLAGAGALGAAGRRRKSA